MKSLLLTVLAVSLVLGFSLSAAAQDGVVLGFPLSSDAHDGVIYGCYKMRNGQLRIVKSPDNCRRSENAISWNMIGPAGPAGADGADGKDGVCECDSPCDSEEAFCSAIDELTLAKDECFDEAGDSHTECVNICSLTHPSGSDDEEDCIIICGIEEGYDQEGCNNQYSYDLDLLHNSCENMYRDVDCD